jgi:hypothetical protein
VGRTHRCAENEPNALSNRKIHTGNRFVPQVSIVAQTFVRGALATVASLQREADAEPLATDPRPIVVLLALVGLSTATASPGRTAATAKPYRERVIS